MDSKFAEKTSVLAEKGGEFLKRFIPAFSEHPRTSYAVANFVSAKIFHFLTFLKNEALTYYKTAFFTERFVE